MTAEDRERVPAEAGEPAGSSSAEEGTAGHCLHCGALLAAAAEAGGESAVAPGPMLIACAECGVEQVGGGPALCDGERLALRHALEYLRRRHERDAPG